MIITGLNGLMHLAIEGNYLVEGAWLVGFGSDSHCHHRH